MIREKDEGTEIDTHRHLLADIQRLGLGQATTRGLPETTERVPVSHEIGTQNHDPEPVDATEVKDAVLGDLQAYIEETNATVESASLPTVRADRDQLHRVLLHLVSNAIKFVPDERDPDVKVHATRGDGSWHFAVEDNGGGLSPVDREGIFQPDHRGDNAEAVEGDGVGLTVCRQIVEDHGGRIWVESGPGPGSTFHFTLPA